MQVSIIGAGLSGSALAHLLQQQDFKQVKVYDKSRGRGGRMATKRLSWGHMDMGAQYFTAKSEVFQKATRLWQQDGWIETWPFVPLAEQNNVLTLSPDNQTRFVATPDMNSLCKRLLKGVDLEVNRRIAQIGRVDGHWYMFDENQELIAKSAYLVLTCPLEQSRALLSDLPHVLAQLPKSAHLPCWSVGIATEGHVDEAVQGIFAQGELSWISRQNAKPQRQNERDLWSIQFSAPWSEEQQMTDSQTVVSHAFDLLKQKLSSSNLCSEALQLSEGYGHFWRYARPDPNVTAPQQTLCLLELGLIVAGDWCYGGRVEGAYLSADDAASKLTTWLTNTAVL